MPLHPWLASLLAALQLSKTSHSPLWHGKRNICFFWQLADGLSFLVGKQIPLLCQWHFWVWQTRFWSRKSQNAVQVTQSRRVWGKRLASNDWSHALQHFSLALIQFLINFTTVRRHVKCCAITKLVLNTCKRTSNICYFRLGASLSANLGGDNLKEPDLDGSLQHVTAGSSSAVLKGLHPASQSIWIWSLRTQTPYEQKKKADELAPLHPDSWMWPRIRYLLGPTSPTHYR